MSASAMRTFIGQVSSQYMPSALIVTWVRTASILAVVWLVGGLALVALFAH